MADGVESGVREDKIQEKLLSYKVTFPIEKLRSHNAY